MVKTNLEDWQVEYIYEALCGARVALLEITGLDSEDEIKRKELENDSAAVRAINRSLKFFE